MNRSSVEQALTGLIPALNGPLPPELVELAASLLARSRSVANSLKPDEEIARPYACAQLACERSKNRFNLPAIVSRPPCPPRVYKKLHSYLSSALPAPEAAAREPQTPSRRTASAAASSRTTPKTPNSGRRTPRSTRKPDAAADVPEWVMLAIRSLVKAFDVPNAAPHVFTGVESVLPLLARMSAAAADTPSKRPRRKIATAHSSSSPVSDARILGLIGVLFLYIYAKVQGVEVTPEQYSKWRATALEALLGPPVALDVSYDELVLETEELMPMARSEGWLQMEWALNVVPTEDQEAMDGVEYSEQAATPSQKKHTITKLGGSDYIGLGTMMQDATDYLGERQREDYKQWRARILARVQEIETA